MNLSDFPIELQLIVKAIKFSHVPSLSLTSEIENLSQREDINWLFFSDLTLRHKVTPHLLPTLSQFGIKKHMPLACYSALKMHATINSCYVLKMIAEAKRLTTLLANAGIPSLLLKGPALSQQLYGQFATREPRDLDLLISNTHLKVVHSLILQSGYVCCVPIEQTLTPKQFKFYQKQKKSFVYYHKKTDQQLELHWRLFDDAQLFPFELSENISSLDQLHIADATIFTLGQEDNLLYLLLHGSHHAWSQLSWVYDIAQLVHRASSLNWIRIQKRVETLQITFPITEGLLLAHLLFDTPLPPFFSELLKKHPVIKTLAGLSLRVIQNPVYMSKSARLTMFVREFRLHMALGSYLKPFTSNFDMVAADWELVHLPDKLFFLYYLLRPYLWIYRKILKYRSKKWTREPL
ncbi:MAG: nucleotidyltransferase family protein [Legionella sp.]|nr:nucleotidyltransferase family protein [Legionella sp.]